MEVVTAVRTSMVTTQLLFAMLTSFLNNSQYYPQQAVINNGSSFDFVVVGGGSAGLVIANRLTEIQNCTVLVIEAGDYPTALTDNPGFLPIVLNSPADWNYTAVNDGITAQAHTNQVVREPRGKVLGGSSGINFMIHVRGNKVDYDSWEAMGNKGWAWKDVLPYFKKSERYFDPSARFSNLRGYNGYLGVTKPKFTSLTDGYFEALKEDGRKIIEDYNGPEQLGFSDTQYTIYNGRRQSTAEAYIKPIKHRTNLFLLLNSLATKIIIDNKNRAIGVTVLLPDQTQVNVMANKEVILSAGAVNTPQLLMLSGIGPKDHLKDMNIKVKLDSPNIGQNLQNHPMVAFPLSGEIVYPSSSDITPEKLASLYQYPGPVVTGHVALNKCQSYPDYQVYLQQAPPGSLALTFVYLAVGLVDSISERFGEITKEQLIYFVNLINLHPKSRGEIKLRSHNPKDKPLLYMKYLSHPDDMKSFLSYIKDILKITDTSYFRKMNSSLVDVKVSQCSQLQLGSDDYWRCYVTNTLLTQYHLCGTCAMGKVVDSKLRLIGIKSLRVVDASVFPKLTSGNINAPTIMIAEKAADMIKADNNL